MSKTLPDGRRLDGNTPEEEAAIEAGIAADPDTYEPTEEEARQLRRVGRPPAAVTKERITIRLSPDVVERFRASGPGWQGRMNAALQDWLREHEPEQAEAGGTGQDG
ncbi:BrnA antitoxin family protein [Thiohalospira halophila]|nr:BrnA antitoxin family protein [Thiohalospira halophila]